MQHYRDIPGHVKIVNVTAISTVVMIAPDKRYGLKKGTGMENQYFVMEKPGLKVLARMGIDEEIRDE